MSLVEVQWNPSERQLRQFALIAMVAFPLVGWFWDAGGMVLGGLVVAGLLIGLLGLWVPDLLKPLFVALMLIAAPIGLVIGELAMIIIYFGVFLPIGLAFRVLGRDALQRELDRNATSYWSAKRPPKDVSSYYRQW